MANQGLLPSFPQTLHSNLKWKCSPGQLLEMSAKMEAF
uniref:Uncharacterized protein n=1 Tax=Picea sitchensis TaxID=3332 RepID=A9NZA0_PICSI|nr:unknown [Picea sitchensis]